MKLLTDEVKGGLIVAAVFTVAALGIGIAVAIDDPPPQPQAAAPAASRATPRRARMPAQLRGGA